MCVEFIIRRAGSSGAQMKSRNIQFSLLSRRLPLYPLFPVSRHPSSQKHNKGGVRAVGKDTEAEGRTRKRNRGFKEGK